MITIIPMAGKGERFLKKGYQTPKPLISIGDVPMVIKAVLGLPKADDHIFIALKEHLSNCKIDDRIKEYLPQAKFVSLDQVTEGQACTCLLGLEHLALNEEILIGACDNGMIFDRQAFDQRKKISDVIVFTFRNNVTVIEKPEQYGWVKLSNDGAVEEVSVKKPISNSPQQDHAIVGAFWFKQADIFKKATERMIAENRRINHEFYVDECINDAIALGYRISVFEIDKYICWGTPNDFETFNYWKTFYQESVCYQ